MRGFLPGMLVGLLVGGGGVYLGMTRPWSTGGDRVAAADAGPSEAKNKRKRSKKRHKRRRPRSDEPGEIVLTDADQKLRWRGRALELPKRDVDFAGGDSGRTLSASEINSVIKNRSQPVVDCIKEARGEAPLKTAVTLELLVDGNGKVEKSRVRAPAYLFDHGFGECVGRAARQLRFPATGAPTIVTAPYDLY